MDHDGCVEVTILESNRKVSPLNSLRASTTRTLSKLRQNHDRTNIDSDNKIVNSRHSLGAKKLWSRVQSFAEKGSTLRQSNDSLDIELLLRLYACNSNMEKSIQRVIEQADERNFDTERYQKTLSANFPSMELGAAYRLIHFLKESCCKNPTSSSPSYCEILLALRKLVADCNDKRLKNFLLNDPSLIMCERCGVISCAGPLDLVHQQCHSHEKPHFSKGAGCSRIINTDDLIRAYKRIKNSKSEREQAEKLFITKKVSDEKRKTTKERDKSLVPEKEISPKGHKIIELHIAKEAACSDSNVNTNQTTNTSNSILNKIELQSKYKLIPNSAINTENSEDYHSKQAEKFHSISGLRRDERKLFSDGRSRIPHVGVARCEKKRGQSDFKAELLNTSDTIGIIDERSNNAPGPSITSGNVRAMVDKARYLARSPFTAASTTEREAVSQLCDAMTSRKSRRIVDSQDGFVLHGNCDDIPQIEANFSLHERADSLLQALREAEEYAKRNDHCERKLAFKYMEHAHQKQSKSESLTWSVENDSLENCTGLPEIYVQPGESDTTGYSSSSAENVMREWLSRHAPKENDSTRSIAADASSNILGQIAARITSRHEAGAVSYSSRTSVVPRQTRIDAPSLPRCISKNHLSDARSLSSKNDTTLIPPIEEKDELEETRDEFNKNPQDYESFLCLDHQEKSHASSDVIHEIKKSLFDEGRSDKSIYNRNPSTHMSVQSNRQAIAMEMLSFYQKMFDDTKKMDWESFQVFVEDVHPKQKEIWRDICRAIANEARRAADEEGVNTEVCIEISPIDRKDVKKETRISNNEIVFEMDITFADIETFLDKGLTSTNGVELDTYQTSNVQSRN